MGRSRGRNVLITGASSGIGRATALYLAEKGFSVIGTGRSLARLGELRSEADSRGLDISTIEVDINTDHGVADVVPGLIAEHGSIDVLVNNAGYSLWGPVQSLSMDELRGVMETNFFAAFRLVQAVLPDMLRRGSGTIVNVSSVEGRLVTPFNGGYAASKFGLEGLSEAMRLELWPLGVRVTVVEPGLFATSLLDNQVLAARAEDPDLPYGPYIARYRKRRRKYDRLAKDPIKVAKVIHRIVNSRRPRFRYVVGAEATLGILGARFLPERLFQTLLSRALMR
jgi:NAD(P)-dependent dehydrogenase (short-subunit alcohol dehydrogenase family)